MEKKEKNKSVSPEVMDTRKNRVKGLISDAILKISNEITLHEKGLTADSTVSILTEIKRELKIMEQTLSPEKFTPTYNYIIRDSWGSFPKLGELLLYVVHEYNEKLI